MFDAVPDQIYLFDSEMRYLYVNSAGASVLSLAPSEIQGKTWHEVGSLAELIRDLNSNIRNTFKTGWPKRGETNCYAGDEKRYFEYILTPIRNQAGKVGSVLATIRDITERKIIEEELNYQRILLQTVFESTPEYLYILDRDMNYLYISPSVSNLLDLASEEMLNMNWQDLSFPADLTEPFEIKIKEVFATGKTVYLDSQFLVGGENRYYENVLTPVHTDPDQVEYILISARDITKRKWYEQALKETMFVAEKRAGELDTILSSITDGLIIYDKNGHIIQMNEVARDAFGYIMVDYDRFIGDDGIQVNVFLPDGRQCRLKDMPAYLALHGEVIRNVELQIIKHAGITMWVIASVSPLKDSTGNIFGAVLTFKDITERKWLEESLQKAKEGLEQRVIERTVDLQAAHQSLKEQNRYLDAFFEHAMTPLVFLDHNFNFIRVNKAYAEADQRSVDEFPGHNHFEFYPSDAKAIFEEVLRTRQPYQVAARPFVYHDNPERCVTYWNWTLTPLLNDRGEVEVLVFALEDVTERKQAEIELEKHREHLEELVRERTKELEFANAQLQAEIAKRKQAEEILYLKNERLRILSESAGSLLSNEKPDQIVQTIATKVMQHLHCDVFFNYILDESKGCLRLNAYSSIPAEVAKDIEWLDLGVAICGCVARDGCKIISENIAENGDVRAELVRSFGINAYACHPLHIGDQTVGTLSFGTRSKTGFTDDQLDMMRMVADQVSIAKQRKRAEEVIEVARLKAISEKNRLRAVMEALPVGVAILDAQGGNVDSNSAFEKIWGGERPLVNAINDYEAYQAWWVESGQPVQPEEWASARAVQKGETVLGQLMKIARFDGTYGFVLNSGAPVYDAHGEIVGCAVALQDITELKQAEEELRRNQVLLKAVVDGSPNPVFIKDQQSRMVMANPATLAIIGKLAEEVIGKDDSEHYDPSETGLIIMENDRRIMESGQTEIVEETLFIQGKRRFFLSTKAPWRDSGGNVIGLLGIAQDITERKQAEEALRESEERFRLVFRNAPVSVAAQNIDLRYVWAYNQKTAPPEGIIGKFDADLFTPDEVARITANKRRVLEENITLREQMWLDRPSGRILLDICYEPIHDKAGRVVGVGSVTMDLTTIKLAEEALRQSEERFRAIFQCSTGGKLLVDMDGIIIEANQAFADMLGYTLPEVQKIDILRITYPDDFELTREAFRRVHAGEQTMDRFEKRYLHKNGNIIWVDVSFTLMRDANGAPLYFISNILDITERKRAEAENLASEREMLRVTLDSLGEGVLAVNRDMRIIFINESAAHLIGYSQNDVIEQQIDQVFYVFDERTSEPIDITAVRSGLEHPVLVNRELKEIPISMNCSPIKSTDGQIIGTVIVFQDISEKQKIEQEMLKTAKLDSLGILAGGVAHDFNNILAAILANLQLAMMKLKKHQDVSTHLEGAIETTRKASELTKQLLTFAKGGDPVKKSTTITNLVKDTVQFALSGSNVKPEFHLPEDLWVIDIDEGQISQVINNLTINAEQAMLTGGILEIYGENINIENTGQYHPGKYVKLIVKDHGIGIPPEIIDKIFDPFFTTKKTGNGLGLSTSYSIIKKHNGYLEVESIPGTGTTFYILLPASMNELTLTESHHEIAASGEAKIILMDDEDTVRNMGGEMLIYYGYRVTLARDGQEAIGLYKKAKEMGEPFEVVIMDLTVPGGLGGIETMAILRQLDPEVKAIISSGYANDPVMADYERYGFSGVVTKPYKYDELIEVLNNVVDRKQLPLGLKY